MTYLCLRLGSLNCDRTIRLQITFVSNKDMRKLNFMISTLICNLNVHNSPYRVIILDPHDVVMNVL
jgi:hypothetical protein